MASLARWRALLVRLGGERGQVYAALVERYAEPHRAYHTLTHIGACLALLDGARHLAQRPDEVEAALWLHDVVYDPRDRRDNEAQSARWAMDHLQAVGVSVERARYVGDLILATRHDEASPCSNALPDAALVADIDLAILGAKQKWFDRYEVQIRREYDWVPEKVFRKGRAEVLHGFLQRATIFQTALFRARYEDRARENLGRALCRLEA